MFYAAFIIVLAQLFRVLRLEAAKLYLDEACSLRLARLDASELLRALTTTEDLRPLIALPKAEAVSSPISPALRWSYSSKD